LINSIEDPIKRRCDEFIRKNMHVGAGVKNRINELYRSMASEVTEAAKEPATRILQRLFRDVEKEILAAFKEHENPLDAVGEAIVASKRNDAEMRRRTLEQLDHVFAAMPQERARRAAS
jgi:hypothetical protein